MEWTDESLADMKARPDQKATATWLQSTYHDIYLPNRISFFLAHSGGAGFINDHVNPIVLLYAGNQSGKTYHLLAWLILRAIENNPKWPCFLHNKIKPLPWNGAKRLAAGTYQKKHLMRNIWPKLCQLMPEDILGEYSPEWAMRNKRAIKEPSWNLNPSCRLKNGTVIDFYNYESKQRAFESCTYDAWAFDEQVKQSIFDAAFARGATIQSEDKSIAAFQCAVACTAVIEESQKETGSGTWIVKAMKQENHSGVPVGVYQIKTEEVPDAIVSKKQKALFYEKYIVAPLRANDKKAIRKGRARWYGEPEVNGGLMYPQWDRSLMAIDNIDVPAYWSRFRAIDPGRTDPTCCLFIAMSPWGDFVIYDEYYETDKGIYESVRDIVAKSGNILEKRSERLQVSASNSFEMYQELESGQQFIWSVLDPRTFATPTDTEPSITIGQIWNFAGLRCIQGSGQSSDRSTPIMREWLEPIKGHPHILVNMKKLESIQDDLGRTVVDAPRFYVVKSRCPKFIDEIESFCENPNKPGFPLPKQADHAMTAWKYAALQNPRYMGPALEGINLFTRKHVGIRRIIDVHGRITA